MLSKSRFLGLHLRVDRGCLLGKRGTNLWAGLMVGALGYQGGGICAIYVCMCSCVYACVQRPDVYMTCHSSSYFFFLRKALSLVWNLPVG